ncbi:MAG: hypothetical protein ABS87_10300 [Sphingomonas sp. SCN 67-18]|nr:hypothetical protein [Sphingomonas sp. SCN 67-18]ODU20435.1 MAG: hypothetical protein ABS87_10300 [Sphingomonas sp. SCN 67-18]
MMTATTVKKRHQNAGQDRDIRKRLKRDPENPDAKLDVGLDESMDASDPPAVTTPGAGTEPAPSSGYDEAAEKKH